MQSTDSPPTPQTQALTIIVLQKEYSGIKGTKGYGITYHAHPNRIVGPMDSNMFYGFSDAAYANTEDKKSISGYVYITNRGAITWGSKKQNTIALSLTEAEYVALLESRREAIWL